jgi:hypothetical protein
LLDEDGNTQRIGISLAGIPLEFYNLRYVDLDAEPIKHHVEGYGPGNVGSCSAPPDLSPALLFRLTMTCQNMAGPLDGTMRACPTP